MDGLNIDDEEAQPSGVADDEMQKVMAPHLAAMRKEVKANWPQMEPELMLLHWLCQRHQLETPKVPLAKKKEPVRKTLSQPSPPGSAVSSSRRSKRGYNPKPTADTTDSRIKALEIVPPTTPEKTPKKKPGFEDHSPDSTLSTRDTEPPRTISPDDPFADHNKPHESQQAQNRDLIQITPFSPTPYMKKESRTKLLSRVPFLAQVGLSEVEWTALVSKLRCWCYSPGDEIIKEGEAGNSMFIIEKGTCEVFRSSDKRGTKLGEPLLKGGIFGELALVYSTQRCETVKAVSSVSALSLGREDIVATLNSDQIEKMRILGRVQVFSNIPVLAKLGFDLKVRIAGMLKTDSWKAGAVIVREDQKMDGQTRRLYLIQKGHCTSTVLGHRNARNRTTPLPPDEFLHSTSFFGMHEFLHGCPSLVTVTANTEAVTLSISFDELQVVLGPDTHIAVEVMTRSVRMHLIQKVHTLLKQCCDEELRSLLEKSTLHQYMPREMIFKKGETLDRIFLLEEGSCIECDGDASKLGSDPLPDAETVEHYIPGDTFGTRSIIGKSLNLAPFNLIAESKCTILQIYKNHLELLPRFRNLLLPKLAHGSQR